MKFDKHFSFDDRDFEFMRSLSSAVLEDSPRKLRFILLFWLITVFLLLLWAAFSPIDELVRGSGKVIPSGENQMIQNLEGGMVSEILVKEGQKVKENDILLRVENLKSSSSFESSQYKWAQLRAKIVRLRAEAMGAVFSPTADDLAKIPAQIAEERNLYNSDQESLRSQVQALRDQYAQKASQKIETQGRIVEQKSALALIKEEVAITEPMVAQGIKPKVEFLKLQREMSNISERYNALLASIPQLNSEMNEINSKIRATQSEFRMKAQQDLNDAQTQYQQVAVESTAYADQVDRTTVKSPISGIVQKLYVNTVGGVIKPGDDLVEIVPTEGGLLVEAKIKPADIAFIYPGQSATVKVTAYDFSIYGSLKGKVVTVSPDTVTDKNDNVYYVVKIKTDKKYLGSEEKPLKIIPGMMVNVDIVTGKKTILEYIFKPILKAKQYTFSER